MQKVAALAALALCSQPAGAVLHAQVTAAPPGASERHLKVAGDAHPLATPTHAQAFAANTKAGKLLPIGEGAYQDPKAVEQRTTDSQRACEDGNWAHCLGHDKSDLLDGHSYGNVPPPPARSLTQASGRHLKVAGNAHPLATPAHAQAFAANTKAGKLLPIGEGAYQDPKAVEQRTTDTKRACEDGNWNNCFGHDKSDLLDGHSYGHVKTPPARSLTQLGDVLTKIADFDAEMKIFDKTAFLHKGGRRLKVAGAAPPLAAPVHTQAFAAQNKAAKLLPIGEGAYQDPKAVEQRTTDASRACEDGNWANCLGHDKSDLLDGHSYGHVQPPPRALAQGGRHLKVAGAARPLAVPAHAPNFAAQAKAGKLLPIGEGAYQNPEAVKQRTTDSKRACEDGNWSHCLGHDKSDLLDGHSYGNVPPAPRALAQASGRHLKVAGPDHVLAPPVHAKAVAAHVAEEKLLPIGEGAYQDPKAVEQRTTDHKRACEDGNWSNCFGKDKSDLLDGHSYGHVKK